MAKIKANIWDRYTKAADRLRLLEKPLREIRDELEGVDIGTADELYARTEELLREYSDAIDEYTVCDYAGNYTNVIDFHRMKEQRELMIKIMRCVANTEDWTHEQVADMARKFLKDK